MYIRTYVCVRVCMLQEQSWRSTETGLCAYSVALLNNVSYNVMEFAKAQVGRGGHLPSLLPCCITTMPCCITTMPCCITTLPCCITTMPCCITTMSCCITTMSCCINTAAEFLSLHCWECHELNSTRTLYNRMISSC